jgi:hypothetical protein
MSLCDNKQFQLGNVHTDFIKENRDALFHLEQITPTIAVAAASAFINSQQQVQYNTSLSFYFLEKFHSINVDSRRSAIVFYNKQ